MRPVRTIVLIALLLTGVAVLAAPATAGEEEEQTQAIRGTITTQPEEGDPQPVEGVEIHVTTAEDEEIGTAVTDSSGEFLIEVPEPGRYKATLDEETLPEDTGLRNPDRATLEFNIRPGQTRTVLFPLGEPRDRTGLFLARGLQLVAEGVKFGLIIALTAIGLSLIFGTTGLVNFAHGELVTFGALVAYAFNVHMGIHLLLAAPLAIIVGGVGAGLLDRGLWRPLRKRGTGLIAMLVVSIGLSLLLRYLFLLIFAGRTRPYAQYAVQRAIDIGPFALAPKDIALIIGATAILVGIALLLQKTKIGKAMRAVADNRDLAESSGINVERVILFVWVFGGALAALGGIMFGLGEQVSWQMGFQLLLLIFAGVILGGLGTAYGALVGSLIVGLFIQVSTLWIPSEMKNVGAMIILILILLVRPQGILGSPERVG